MLRRPPSLELITLDTNNVKVVDNVLYIGSMPPITADNIIACNLLCPSTGTKQVVRICPVINSGCECPFSWDLTGYKLPDLTDYGTDQTFQRPRFYNYESPDGGVPTASALADAIVAQINADTEAPFTATKDGSNCIVLTGKLNGHTFAVYAPAATITESVYGDPDALTATQLKRLFPIQVGQFGQSPAAVDKWCACHCLLKVKVKFCCETDLPSDAYDIDMDRALLGHEYEFAIAIPCDYNEVDGEVSDDPTLWAEPWKSLVDFFTCIGPDDDSSESIIIT